MKATKHYLPATYILLVLCLNGCNNTNKKIDVNVRESEISTYFIEARKPLNDLWTLKSSYTPINGKQSNIATLTTRLAPGAESNNDVTREEIDFGNVNITSPYTVGTETVDFSYDTKILNVMAELPIGFLYPFDFRYAFGVQIEDKDYDFLQNTGSEMHYYREEDYMPVFEVSWHYSFNRILSASVFANAANALHTEAVSRTHGAQLNLRVNDHIKISGRAFAHNFRGGGDNDDDDNNGTTLRIRSNATAVGITFSF